MDVDHNKAPKQYRQSPLRETCCQQRKQHCTEDPVKEVMVEAYVPGHLRPPKQAIHKVDRDTDAIRVRKDAAPSDQTSVSVIKAACFGQRP